MPSETIHFAGTDFGRQFTDHMVIASYRAGDGWTPAEVVAFGDLALSPATMVFHYGQAIFEGLKAFRQPDSSVSLFRPADHAARFNRSAARLAMPGIPAEMFVEACAALAAVDRDRVPTEPDASLYLRPMMIATEVGLGVRPAEEYLFAVIASPAGSYFGSRPQAISVWASTDYVRAAPGGTGFAKCSGNYAASLAAKQQAVAHGCDETLWLDSHERRWIEEMGGMNIAFVDHAGSRPTIVTPPVGDTILDGVTRRSILALAPRLGFDVDERPVAIDELGAGGSYREAFACGTAAVIVPVGRVRSLSGEVLVGDGKPGRVTMQLRAALTDVQQGRAADPACWRVPVSFHDGNLPSVGGAARR